MAFTVITCSGISNTGKLTTRVGAVLMCRCGGMVEACLAATLPTESLEGALRHSDRILVLDGCGDCCGRKKVRELGAEPHLHVVATDCGIEKNGMAEPRFDEIERFSAAVLEAIRE